mgnify:CR=1 FL=1
MDPEPKPEEEKPAEEPMVAEGGTVPPLLEEPPSLPVPETPPQIEQEPAVPSVHTPSVETPPAPVIEPVPQPPAEEILPIPPETPREERGQEIKVSEDKKVSELLQNANLVRKQRRESNVIQILELARKKGHIDNQDVRDLLQVSQSTATNYVSELVKSGKLKKEKKARATVYSIK